MRIARRDEAMSDIIGTIILIGITVTLVGVAVAGLYSANNDKTAAPRLDLKAAAFPSGASNGAVTLTHAGGAAFNRSDLDVQVTAGSTVYGRAAFPGTGTWDIGQAVPFTLSKPLAGGEHLEVDVISHKLGAVVSSAVIDVPPSAATAPPAGTFTIDLASPAGPFPLDVQQGSVLRVSALVSHPDGRKAIAAAWIDLSPVKGPTRVELKDDGTGADAVAGDMEYAAYVSIPPDATVGNAPATLMLGAADVDGNLATPSLAQVSVKVILAAKNVYIFANGTNGTNGTFGVDGLPGGTGDNGTGKNGINGITIQGTGGGPLGPPVLQEPGPFDPTLGHGNTRVRVFGTNLGYVNSVRFVDNASGSLGVTWWSVSDDEVDLIAPDVTAEGFYRIVVTNPVGSDTSDEFFDLLPPLNGPGSAPDITGINPTHGTPGAQVTLTGTGLAYLTDVRLVAGSNVFPAAFFVSPDGTTATFFMPHGAPATDYTVTASSAGGSDDAPHLFTVDPTFSGPLAITGFTPPNGTAFTRINLVGTGFLGAIAATVGDQNVAMWVTSDTQMSVLTHPAVPIGKVTITVFNATGSATTCCFKAEPNPTPHEYAVYPDGIFSQVALTTTKYGGSGGSGDSLNSTLKFNLIRENLSVHNANLHLTAITLQVAPLKPGQAINEYTADGGIYALTGTKTPVVTTTVGSCWTIPTVTNKTVGGSGTWGGCGPLNSSSPAAYNRTGIWLLTWNVTVPNYVKDFATVQWLYVATWTGTDANGTAVEYDATIGSTASSQYFSLGPQFQTKTIMDGPNYDWPSSFTDRSAN